ILRKHGWRKTPYTSKTLLVPTIFSGSIDCSSKDDFLGVHDLKPGQTFDFSFNDSIFKTKFDCTLAQGQGFIHQASFRAYEGGGFIVHYGKKNFWDAREDGIYFTHGKETPKLEYKWS
ncbi:unnamed protein product, partial [Brassica oleracea var. botrytis]